MKSRPSSDWHKKLKGLRDVRILPKQSEISKMNGVVDPLHRRRHAQVQLQFMFAMMCLKMLCLEKYCKNA